MKTGKIIIFGLIFGIGLMACQKDDTPETLMTPRADFSFSPISPVEGDEVVFNAGQREGSSEIGSWNWNFGDENYTTSTELDPIFIYEDAGTFEVILQVADAAGNVHRTSKTITVTKAEFPAYIVWEFTHNTVVARLNEGSNAPVIGDDGTIYYVEGNAGEESKVVAVTDQGESAEFKWATAIGHQIANAPSIGPDGNLYINSWLASAGISKLNSVDGSIMWSGSFGTGVSNNTSAIDSQGNIYHGSRSKGSNGGALSWTPSGEKRWEITGVGAFYASPALSQDEKTVYFLNTSENRIWAINPEDGSLKWEESVGEGSGSTGSSLSIDGDGTIYYTSDTHVVAVSDHGETGSIKWAIEVVGAANSGIVIGLDGDLYTGSSDGLISINPTDGSTNWIYRTAEIKESVPAVDKNGNIYVGTSDGKMLIVNAEGELEKEFELGDNVVNSPTIASDGTVFIEVYDGDIIKLFKIAVDESGPAISPWPMKGQNSKNTGRAN